MRLPVLLLPPVQFLHTLPLPTFSINYNRYSKLKAVVPSVVLKSCLDEMVDRNTSGNPFAEDSDDDDDEPKKKKKSSKKSSSSAATSSTDEYAGSLRLKEGRNINNNLYYVDHTKQANEGNGLLPEVRNELIADMAKSKAEFDMLSAQLKATAAEAVQLGSEPKNEELVLEVADLETKMTTMDDNIAELRKHAANEAHVKKVKKETDSKASTWRKRKRMCTEFISTMEECTEGTISLKKVCKRVRRCHYSKYYHLTHVFLICFHYAVSQR